MPNDLAIFWIARTLGSSDLFFVLSRPLGLSIKNVDCGSGRIRTSDGVTPMPHFECGAFGLSATLPLFLYYIKIA